MGGVNHRLSARLRTMDRLESESEKMKPFEKCPLCGSDLEKNKSKNYLAVEAIPFL